MNLSIALTGLKAAQRAMELVGTNLANASTEGYHRQRIDLAALDVGGGSTKASIGGVEVLGSTRQYNVLLEREQLRMKPEFGKVEQELQALNSIEAVMGNIDGDPLGESLGEFFAALNDLAADPTQLAYAQQVVWSADAMCTNFRALSDFLVKIKEQLKEQASHIIEEVNNYAASAAELNKEIELALRRGTSPNLLQDHRDQAISQMAERADVTVSGMSSEDGQVNAFAWGTPLVLSEQYQEMEVGLTDDGKLGVSVKGLSSYSTYADGGKIGALINLHNEVIPKLQNRLNTMAEQVINQINGQHAQGLGPNGSFTELQGIPINRTLELDQYNPPIGKGTVHLRLTDDAGNVTVHDIHIDPNQTIQSVIDQINAFSPGNLSASIVNGCLYIQADNDYKFDFVPDYTVQTANQPEIMLGPAVLGGTASYLAGDAAGDELVFDLGTTAAEELTYTIGSGIKTLNDVVTDINALSNAAHAGWNAASIETDPATGYKRLKLTAYDDEGYHQIDMTNNGAVRWAQSDKVVQVDDDHDLAFQRKVGWAGLQAGSPTVTVDGLYRGENQTYRFEVTGPDGEVGIDPGLEIKVYNGNNELVKTLRPGLNYAAGDPIDIENGMRVYFSTGELRSGDSFAIEARSSSDDSGVLNSTGMNTFFSGADASDIEVRGDYYDDPFLFASGISPDSKDNFNIQIMSELQNTRLEELGGTTLADYFNDTVTDVGQQVALREARHTSLESVMRELANQRDLVSGVDPNEEVASMLVFEKMFQAMSRFLNTQNNMMETLMQVL
jgi:flagellar hook-associated protein FlgK